VTIDKAAVFLNHRKLLYEISKLRHLIVAPILVGVISVLASVLGAGYMFGNSGDAESSSDKNTERNDFIVGQLFPSAVNFIFVTRHLAQLPFLFFRWGKLETAFFNKYRISRARIGISSILKESSGAAGPVDIEAVREY
jgi:hypothetical protein